MKILLCCCLLLSGITIHAQGLALKDSVVAVDSKSFMDVESSFPGGLHAWIQFLTENLKYPKKAARKNIEGTVVLQFIVDKDGSITDLQAISGPEELREAALDVLRKSPNWSPASQNGRKVKSYKKQPITFKLTP
jgi:periplasmic protein TonB